MKMIIAILMFVLVGCTTTPQIQQCDDIQIIKAQNPTPIYRFQPTWRIINVDGNSYVALEWDDSIEYRKWLEDVYRYISEQKTIITYYEENLK